MIRTLFLFLLVSSYSFANFSGSYILYSTVTERGKDISQSNPGPIATVTYNYANSYIEFMSFPYDTYYEYDVNFRHIQTLMEKVNLSIMYTNISNAYSDGNFSYTALTEFSVACSVRFPQKLQVELTYLKEIRHSSEHLAQLAINKSFADFRIETRLGYLERLLLHNNYTFFEIDTLLNFKRSALIFGYSGSSEEDTTWKLGYSVLF